MIYDHSPTVLEGIGLATAVPILVPAPCAGGPEIELPQSEEEWDHDG